MKRNGGFVRAVLAAFVTVAAANASQMSVQVREGPVRSAPSFTGRVITTLPYGERVNTLERKAGWVRISSGAHTGWMHESALSSKRIVLQSGTATAQTAVSSEELALAGKGFNSEVEAKFKEQNAEANYAAVDRMEQRTVSREEMEAFLSAGGVR